MHRSRFGPRRAGVAGSIAAFSGRIQGETPRLGQRHLGAPWAHLVAAGARRRVVIPLVFVSSGAQRDPGTPVPHSATLRAGSALFLVGAITQAPLMATWAAVTER